MMIIPKNYVEVYEFFGGCAPQKRHIRKLGKQECACGRWFADLHVGYYVSEPIADCALCAAEGERVVAIAARRKKGTRVKSHG